MTKWLVDFLNKNEDLINNNEWEELYNNCVKERRGVLTKCLLSAELNILEEMDKIPDYAFHKDKMKSFTIPNHIKTIGENAFSLCENLASVKIGNNVKTIGSSAFFNCTSLTSVTIPNSVISIGDLAFFNCTSLKSITIPDSVKSVGKNVFSSKYSSIESVYITDIEAWCNISFADVDANPMFLGASLYLNGELVTDITIKSTISSIKNYAFRGCKSLISVTIPNHVISIGEFAFSLCPSLTNVIIGDGIERIGMFAFSWCTNLTSITIPDGVTSIGNGAFNGCTNLKSIVIPSSVTSIGGDAFYKCENLEIKYGGSKHDWENLVKDKVLGATYTCNCIDGRLKKSR